ELNPEDDGTQKFMKWPTDVHSAFFHIFGEDSRQNTQLPRSYRTTPSGIRKYFNVMVSVVESNLDDLTYICDDDEESAAAPLNQSISSAFDVSGVDKRAGGNRVFVIHGRDEAVREMVARFLEKFKLEPVILHEQPNRGRTTIEKFEDHADVGFAVVLLTPDDAGALAGNGDDPKPRARQNVILELGFFLGKLGRERVCSLVKGDVETPSDYDGVVHTRFDNAGGWTLKLAQELKAAGFDVDVNRVFQT
ncbi:MAG: nucleotide-binding protein, partial [Albidovulum sp.]|nr:nucleotide-binding protein [Albidovulum sp.]